MRRYLANLVNVLSAQNRLLEQLVREHVRTTESEAAYAGFLLCSRMYSHVSVSGGFPLAQHTPYTKGEVGAFLEKSGLYVPVVDGGPVNGAPGAGGRLSPKKRSKKRNSVAAGAGDVSAPAATPVTAQKTSRKRKAATPVSTPAAKRSASSVPGPKTGTPASAVAAKSGKKGTGSKKAGKPTERELRAMRRTVLDGTGVGSDTSGSAPNRPPAPGRAVAKKAKQAAQQADEGYESADGDDSPE